MRKERSVVFRSILVALCQETRRPSSPAVQQAIWLARREQARLVGLYVVDEAELVPPPLSEGVNLDRWREEVESELKVAGQKLLDDFAARCARADVPAETRLKVGSVAQVVCRQARTADLLVMERSGDYAHRMRLLECAPLEGVVRRAGRPVLVATAGPGRVERILVAYDGGERASTALALAVRIAVEWEVPLTLLTVVERGVDGDVLAEGREYCRPYGIPVEPLLREGTPADEILRASRERGAGLVVMGAYCHNRVQELILGGTVGQVLQRADCPVLICR